MAKRRGKQLMSKEQSSNQPSSNVGVRKKSKKNRKSTKTKVNLDVKVGHFSSKVDVASAPIHSSTPALVPLGNDKGKQKDMEEKKHFSCPFGFIFMCNGITKPECYKHRVFGLPKGKIDVVKNIAPNIKLFLYDTDLKLLYGIYQATSRGTLDSESKAFFGKYPAQVKFKIFKECLPLPETAFKNAIKENYEDGRKFRQELSSKQVKKLVSLFRPIDKPIIHSNVAIQQSFMPTATTRMRVPESYPIENSSLGLHRLPILKSGSQYAVQHGEYDPFEPGSLFTQAQVETRHVRVDAPLHQLDPYHLGRTREPYVPDEMFLLRQDSYGRSNDMVEIQPRDYGAYSYGRQYNSRQLVVDREDDRPRVDYKTSYYYNNQHPSPNTSQIIPSSQLGSSLGSSLGLGSDPGYARHSLTSPKTSQLATLSQPSLLSGSGLRSGSEYARYSLTSTYQPLTYLGSSGLYDGGSPKRPVSGNFPASYVGSNLQMSYYSFADANRPSYR